MAVIDIDTWLATISAGRSPLALDKLRHAATLVANYDTKHPGDPLIQPAIDAAIRTTYVLNELQLDEDGLIAALLHRPISMGCLDSRQIGKVCGRSAMALVEGVTKMDAVPTFADETPYQPRASAENLRKMLLAMVDDVRVVLIRLAEQLQTLRELKHVPGPRQSAIARETLDIFAPLANRLGIWQLKWELEDLSLRYLEPEIYQQIATRLAERRVDRERYIERFVSQLKKELDRVGVQAEISGRAKHIYSIWKKMKRKDIDFDRIFDVRAVRVLVDSVQSCYATLGVVHGLWPHVGGEFDDYIATPKKNHYQSIHTAVIAPEDRVMEVQIRTHQMHRDSELGIAAHWRYKEDIKQQARPDSKVLWLRQLLEWKDEVSDASEFVEEFKSDIIDDRVYVFTPKGNVIDLPSGSTPLDFAYAIHTEVGHRCRGAKVNGKIIPLTGALTTGDMVEVLTVKKGGPSRDWLSPHLGYLKTSRARARVQRWFKEENFEHNVSAGRAALDKELHRLGITGVKFETLANESGIKKVDDFLAAVGRGDLKMTQAVSSLRGHFDKQAAELPTGGTSKGAGRRKLSGLRIKCVGNLLTQLANCCNPVPGDPIIGYITQGRGVSIHRRDCRNMLHILERRRERFVEVDWGLNSDTTYPVDIQVTAFDRHGLLHDITSVFHDAKINIAGVTLNTDKSEHVAQVALKVEISGIEKLSQVLTQIAQIPNVTDVRRIMH